MGLVAACVEPPPTELPEGASAVDPDAPREVWPGKTIAELYDRGEVRGFEFRQAGRVIGRSWGRYEGLAEKGLHRFATRIELDLPDRPPVRSEGEILVAASGELVRGFERSDAAELRFAVEHGLLRVEAGKQHEELSFPPGTAYMAYMATLHEELLFATRQLKTGDMELRLVSLSGGLPTQWSGRVIDRGAGAVEVETNLGEKVELQHGRIRRIAVEADDLEVEAQNPAPEWPDWEIAGPKTLSYQMPPGATFTRREVELPGRPGEPRIFGEVLVPAGTDGPTGAVLFVAGSGLTDRYGFAGPPPVDLGSHEITDALANAGLVVLRYDERGFGRSEGGKISWEGQIEDARRALRTLLVQEEVDPKRVLFVGHGEGGWKAMRLVRERKKMCRGIALLATPGRTYSEILRTTAENTIDRLDPAVRDEARKQHAQLIEELKAGQSVPPEFEEQKEWLRGILAEDPAKLVAKVDCPLWIAHGDKDFEVDPNQAPAALTRFAKRSKRKHAARVYEDLDHLFKAEPGMSRPRRYLEDRRVDPAFLTDLTAWARGRAGSD